MTRVVNSPNRKRHSAEILIVQYEQTFSHMNSGKKNLRPERNVTFGTSRQIFISVFQFLTNGFIKKKYMFNCIRQTNHLTDKRYKYSCLQSHRKTLHRGSTVRGMQN